MTDEIKILRDGLDRISAKGTIGHAHIARETLAKADAAGDGWTVMSEESMPDWSQWIIAEWNNGSTPKYSIIEWDHEEWKYWKMNSLTRWKPFVFPEAPK